MSVKSFVLSFQVSSWVFLVVALIVKTVIEYEILRVNSFMALTLTVFVICIQFNLGFTLGHHYLMLSVIALSNLLVSVTILMTV